MVNAPEKIWVHFSDFDEHDVCTSYPVENAGEYTRTDLYDAAIVRICSLEGMQIFNRASILQREARIAELEARVEQVIKQRNHARKTIGSQKRRLESEIAVLEKVVTALKAKP